MVSASCYRAISCCCTLLLIITWIGLVPQRSAWAQRAASIEKTSADWPHWRGPQRNGIVQVDSGWNGSRWVYAQPDWSTMVGEGGSSPLLADGKVFTLGFNNGEDIISCLDAESGKRLWFQSYRTAKYGRNAVGDEGLYSGPSSTPEYDTDTGYLYTLGSDGDLQCWNTQRQGVRVWHRNLYDDYKMPRRAKVERSSQRDYGYTSSPLVMNDWLLVEVGGPTGTIVAFEKRSGKEVWKSRATVVAGHTGGMALTTVENVPCVAALTFAGLLVVRVDARKAGEIVAAFPWVTSYANNIASPAVQDDCVLITSEYNHGSICKLRITMKGPVKLWEKPYPSKTCTPVIHEDRIYLAWNRLRCLDWKTGELIWEGPVVGDAGSCVVTADNKLIAWTGRGDLLLAETGTKQYSELARLRNLAQSDVWPHVVVTGEQILCRDRAGNLLSFALP